MAMNLQYVLVAMTSLAAAGYLARAAWRTWSSRGCSGGCCKNAGGQAPALGLIAPQELLGRVRRLGRETAREEENNGCREAKPL
jgi:hypothetical protein